MRNVAYIGASKQSGVVLGNVNVGWYCTSFSMTRIHRTFSMSMLLISWM